MASFKVMRNLRVRIGRLWEEMQIIFDAKDTWSFSLNLKMAHLYLRTILKCSATQFFDFFKEIFASLYQTSKLNNKLDLSNIWHCVGINRVQFDVTLSISSCNVFGTRSGFYKLQDEVVGFESSSSKDCGWSGFCELREIERKDFRFATFIWKHHCFGVGGEEGRGGAEVAVFVK